MTMWNSSVDSAFRTPLCYSLGAFGRLEEAAEGRLLGRGGAEELLDGGAEGDGTEDVDEEPGAIGRVGAEQAAVRDVQQERPRLERQLADHLALERRRQHAKQRRHCDAHRHHRLHANHGELAEEGGEM